MLILMRNLSFLLPLLLSSLCFKETNIKSPEVSKKTYLNFTFDSTTFSCNDLVSPGGYGTDRHCGKLATKYSIVQFEPNGSFFQICIAHPKDPILMTTYSINKKHEVASSDMLGNLCPLRFWLSYRPNKNAAFAYVSLDNADTTQQYVVYTKFEKGKPEPGMKNNYYLTGYFQCKVQEFEASGTIPKFMKGDFRVRICFDN
jgi:hypothetical protein